MPDHLAALQPTLVCHAGPHFSRHRGPQLLDAVPQHVEHREVAQARAAVARVAHAHDIGGGAPWEGQDEEREGV